MNAMNNKKEVKMCIYRYCRKFFESYTSSNRKYCSRECCYADRKFKDNPAKRPEVRKLISKSKQGENNPNYGKCGAENPFYGKKHTCATKEKQSKVKRGEKNPFYGKKHTEETIKNILKNRKYCSPNKQEEKVIDLLHDLFPNEWKYVGDGELIIGGKCPDFANINGQKKLIELYGTYWHDVLLPDVSREEEEDRKIKHFSKYGYKTLIIWEDELCNTLDLVKKIKKFNRIEVLSTTCFPSTEGQKPDQ